MTGGIGPFAAIWLVIVPLEAALSASRRVIVLASAFALTAAGLLLSLGMLKLLPMPASGSHDATALAALGVASAALYATGPASVQGRSPAPASGCSAQKRTVTACSHTI